MGPGHLVTASLGHSQLSSFLCFHSVCWAVKHPAIMTWFASCQSIRTFCLNEVVYIVNKNKYCFIKSCSSPPLHCINLKWVLALMSWWRPNCPQFPSQSHGQSPGPLVFSHHLVTAPSPGHHGSAGITDELMLSANHQLTLLALIEVWDDLSYCLSNSKWIFQLSLKRLCEKNKIVQTLISELKIG